MAEYYNVTTNLGDAEIANAIATNTKLDITHVAFGDGNGSVPTPTKTLTSLVREVHRQAVTKYERHATNANWIVIETIIPSDIGGFTIREMGIIANGKLISHGSHAPFEKVADPSGVSEYRLRFVQDITDASVVSIILDQSLIYASQAWVKENYIKRTEIVDNLITADPNKPLSANAGKSLQDGKLGKNDNAVSATKLQTARTIGGVSFDGTTNINLPGVNAAGTQSTTGNAATATTAAACSGNAASATKLQTARTIGGVSFDGTTNIDLPGVNAAGTQSTTGNAATATKLATARTINGVAFDGTTNISITDGTKANLSDFANLKSITGYQKLPNGLILQWGEVTESISGTDYKFFPIAFPNAAYAVIVQLNSNTVGGYASNFGTTVGVVDKTKFLLSVGGSFSAGGAGFYMAIGS